MYLTKLIHKLYNTTDIFFGFFRNCGGKCHGGVGAIISLILILKLHTTHYHVFCWLIKRQEHSQSVFKILS